MAWMAQRIAKLETKIGMSVSPLNAAKSSSPFPHSANFITTITYQHLHVGEKPQPSMEVVERLDKMNRVEASDLDVDACDVHGRIDDDMSNHAIRRSIPTEYYDFITPDTIYIALQQQMNCTQINI